MSAFEECDREERDFLRAQLQKKKKEIFLLQQLTRAYEALEDRRRRNESGLVFSEK